MGKSTGKPTYILYIYIYLLVVSNLAFIFHFIYGNNPSQLTHIFQDGWNHQPVVNDLRWFIMIIPYMIIIHHYPIHDYPITVMIILSLDYLSPCYLYLFIPSQNDGIPLPSAAPVPSVLANPWAGGFSSKPRLRTPEGISHSIFHSYTWSSTIINDSPLLTIIFH